VLTALVLVILLFGRPQKRKPQKSRHQIIILITMMIMNPTHCPLIRAFVFSGFRGSSLRWNRLSDHKKAGKMHSRH